MSSLQDPDRAHEQDYEKRAIASQEEPDLFVERIQAQVVIVAYCRQALRETKQELARRRADFEMANRELTERIFTSQEQLAEEKAKLYKLIFKEV